MKKLRTKIGAIIASAMLAASMMAMPVGAADVYTPVTGSATACTVDKYLVVKSEANIPNATFSFTIAPGTAMGAESEKMAVYAGSNTVKLTGTDVTVDTDNNKKGTVSFSKDDTTTAEAEKGTKTVSFTTTDSTSDEKFATKTIGIDFSDVSFTEPGIYRWILTEDTTTAAVGISFDEKRTRTIDVYVIDNNGTLAISGYVVHTGTAAPVAGDDNGSGDVTTAGAGLDDKSTGFTNKYGTQNLSFAKTVTGNQGSKDKYFKFTVTVTGVHASDSFVVNMENAETAPTANAATVYAASDMATANTHTEVTGQQLLAGKEFYLCSGEFITIKGLPINATYTVAEVAEDYKSSEGAGTIGTVEYNNAVSGTIATADIYTGFTNTRDGVIPTGVILSVAPWVIAGIVIIGGIIFFVVRSKKKYDEE